jgi:hypothetical protein
MQPLIVGIGGTAVDYTEELSGDVRPWLSSRGIRYSLYPSAGRNGWGWCCKLV